jgi:putative ABC transport system permease protein
MNVFETTRNALESLSANKLRTLLTMLGVIIGVASVVALLSIGAGVSGLITDSIKGIGTNVLTIQVDDRIATARLTNADVQALSRLSGLKRVVPELGVKQITSAGGEYIDKDVNGTTPAFFVLRNIQLKDGAVFTLADIKRQRRVIVLGAFAADALFGDSSAVGETVLVGTVPFTVIGIAKEKGGLANDAIDDAVWVPLSVAQEKLYVAQRSSLTALTSIYVEVEDVKMINALMVTMTDVMRREHALLTGEPNDFRILNQTALVSTLDTVVRALTAFLGAIGAISLIVGGIGIMNIMLVSVTERTREIGVRKALGATRANILMQFLVEALTVTGLAGVIGMGVGIVSSQLLARVQSYLTPHVQPLALGVAFGVSMLIGLIFGIYPAWRASHLVPVVALRYE